MLQKWWNEAGGCFRSNGAVACQGCSRISAECPVPTMVCSPGQAQPFSIPFCAAHDGWGPSGEAVSATAPHGPWL